MLKRTLVALLCLPLALVSLAAQLTATLQSGDKVTPFYGSDAFVNAYTAAVDGDIITLSPGSFTSTEIKKAIIVVGAYGFSDDTSLSTVINNFTISADNVTIEGIRCYTITIKGADNLTINRSYIKNLSDTENGDKKYHDNTIVTDCMIDDYRAMSLSKNTVLRNCCICDFSETNLSDNPALIENCNITAFAYYNNSILSSIPQPYAIYRNCFLGLYNLCITSTAPVLNLYSPSEFHNVIFYSNFRDATTSSNAKSWSIQYNSCKKSNAIMGGSKYGIGSNYTACYLYHSFSIYTYNSQRVGPTNHKSDPAIPQISSEIIDTQTDADGNLHVKITAKARD